MKKLRIIEPVVKEKEKLRVATYCRVSTKLEGQQSSIDLQIYHYEAVIQGNPAWQYTGIYFDYGRGLRQKGRSNLEKMIERACNGNSIDDKAEFAITLSGILAQEESRNLSENIQWGYQRKFENGDIFTTYKNFMGYKCEKGSLVIVHEQAEIVRTIFRLYLDGMTLRQIKEYLESNKIKTVTGKDVWAT